MNEELKIIISAEIDKLKEELKKGQDELKKTEKTASDSGSKIGNALKSAGKVVGTAMKVITGAVVAAGAAIIGVTEATREYRTQQAMLATAFQTSGSSAEIAKETYNDLFRVLGDAGQATEAAQHLAMLTSEEESLAEWTTICQGIYATFGESLPIESLTEAANETAKTGELTGALADALNWAGVSEEEFKDKLFECNTEAEREALIRETLSGLYSDAASSYEQTAGSILAANDAQRLLTDAMAEAGGALEPLVTVFKVGLAEALSDILPHLSQVSEGLMDIVNGVDGGAEKMSEGIQLLLNSIVETITSALPTILDIGLDIVKALLDGILKALPDIVQAVADIIPQILDAIGELLPLLIDSIFKALPLIIDCIFDAVGQILDIIGEILPDIVSNIIEFIPQLVDSIIENIPTLLEAAIQFLRAIIQAIPRIIPPLMQSLPTIINSIVNALLDNTPLLLQAGITVFMELVKAIPKVIPELIKGLANLVSSVKTNLVDKLKAALKFKWELPKIKMPKITVEWQKSPKWLAEAAKFIGLQGIPKFAVNWNALGGVFDKPTIFNYGGSLQGIGEDGAEAVVPLEKNTGWLDEIARRLGDRLDSGSREIILQVDGTTLARTSIRSINELTKQTGKLDLVLT